MIGDVETYHVRDCTVVVFRLDVFMGIVSTSVLIRNPHDLEHPLEQFKCAQGSGIREEIHLNSVF